MYDLRISPAFLSGTLDAPPSKSAAHRALICASLADGISSVFPLSSSDDMVATIQVLSSMGGQIKLDSSTAQIQGGCNKGDGAILNCKESGSTLRFLLPVAAALGMRATFCGEGRLPDRPIGVLKEQLEAHGISFSADRMPFSIFGKLSGGQFVLPGDVSSQFVSGLLFALPLLEEDSELRLSSPLESAGYVDMTLCALKRSGIEIKTTKSSYHIKRRQSYRSGGFQVEGDYSNAAFWLCAGVIGGNISVRGLDTNSVQGDRAILEILHRFGGSLTIKDDIIACKKSALHGCRIDASAIPDLVPILAVTGALSRGTTELYNAARLRIKESDRLSTTAALLRNLGGRVEEFPDRLVIHGGRLLGGEVDGANDHRIVMSAAIAAQFCEKPVSISGAHAVQKSYPDFFEKLSALGGQFHVI